MDEKVEALSNLIDKIVKKEILLPDFQRKFIWKEMCIRDSPYAFTISSACKM